MVASLKAAIGRSHLITPALCVRYLRAWQTDSRRWRRHVEELGRDYGRFADIKQTLEMLGIADCAQPGIDGRSASVRGADRARLGSRDRR